MARQANKRARVYETRWTIRYVGWRYGEKRLPWITAGIGTFNMTEPRDNALDRLARRIEAGEGDAAAPSGPDTDAFAAALRTAAAHDDRHLTLVEVEAVVRDPEAQAQGRMLLEHVAACPLCLEACEAVRAGIVPASESVIARFVAMKLTRIEKWREPEPADAAPRSRWRVRAFALAAAVALAVMIGWYFASLRSPATVESGAVLLADGSTVPVGADIPLDTQVHVAEPTDTRFIDGSKVSVQPASRVAFHRSYSGETTVELHSGELTAAVTPQAGGRRFQVRTPLGVVTVVGTKFTVTSRSDPVTVYQQGGAQTPGVGSAAEVRTVIVSVREGKVLVKNAVEEVLVSAGKKAVLHDQPPKIDVSEQ